MNNMNRYNLKNRIKWRKMNFYKSVGLIRVFVWMRIKYFLYNNKEIIDINNNCIRLISLFVCLFYFFYIKKKSFFFH